MQSGTANQADISIETERKSSSRASNKWLWGCNMQLETAGPHCLHGITSTGLRALTEYQNALGLYCRAKAKDRNFDFCRKWVIDIFGTFKTSFIMYICILSQFRCFSEKIMGGLNRNFKKPRRNQGRTPYNTSNGSFTLFGTLKMSYGVLPLINCASKWSYSAGLELYSVLPFFTVH